MSKKEIDRHTEPKMVEYRLRVPEDHVALIAKLAKVMDRTRQSLMREAIRVWLDGRMK